VFVVATLGFACSGLTFERKGSRRRLQARCAAQSFLSERGSATASNGFALIGRGAAASRNMTLRTASAPISGPKGARRTRVSRRTSGVELRRSSRKKRKKACLQRSGPGDAPASRRRPRIKSGARWRRAGPNGRPRPRRGRARGRGLRFLRTEPDPSDRADRRPDESPTRAGRWPDIVGTRVPTLARHLPDVCGTPSARKPDAGGTPSGRSAAGTSRDGCGERQPLLRLKHGPQTIEINSFFETRARRSSR